MHVLVRYANESLFQGEWQDAPDYEVQIVCYIDPNGTAILRHQGDFYRLEDGEIVPHAYHAVVCHAYRDGFQPVRHPELELVRWAIENGYKIASMIGPEKWKRVFELGVQDRDSLLE